MFASRRPFLVSAVVDHKLINKNRSGMQHDRQDKPTSGSRVQQNTTGIKKKRSVNRKKAASKRQENPPSSQKHTKPNKPKTRNG